MPVILLSQRAGFDDISRVFATASSGSDGTLGAQQFSRPPPSASLGDPTAADSTAMKLSPRSCEVAW